MNIKTEVIVSELVQALSSWDCVDSVLLGESAHEDINDPYFSISLDVYYQGLLPGPALRSESFSGCGAFEFSLFQTKDRFLIKDLPVRVEYKNKAKIDSVLNAQDEMLQMFRDSGTYMFYRMKNGIVLLRKTDWIDSAQKRIDSITDQFWQSLEMSILRRTEHFLSDIGAAVINHDHYFYLISVPGFLKSACSFLFAHNRILEPSDRFMQHKVESLPILPTNFTGHFQTILRMDNGLPPEKIHEVALLLTRELIALAGS